MNLDTSNRTYRQLMGSGLIYTVPRFQRDYSWTSSEWDDLWRDIEALFEEDPPAGIFPATGHGETLKLCLKKMGKGSITWGI